MQRRNRLFSPEATIIATALIFQTGCAAKHLAVTPVQQAPVAPYQAPATVTGTEAPIPLGEGLYSEPRSLSDQVFYGTGSTLGQSSGSVAGVDIQQNGSANDVTLNFTNADVRTVTNAVLGDLLKLNYEIAPSVQGTITLTTASPVTRNDVLPVFEQSLFLAGFALVQDSGLYRIIPAADAPRQSGTPMIAQQSESLTPGFGIEILPLSYISADQMQTLLTPMVPAGSIVSTDASRNILIIAGTSEQRATIISDVALFDVDQMAGKSFALFKPQYIDAKDLEQGLSAIIAGPQGQGLGGVVRLITLTELDSVLAISNQSHYLDELRSWVVRLDQPSDSNSQQLYVYPVQNGKASDLATVLTQAFTPTGSTSSSSASSDDSEIAAALGPNSSNTSETTPALPSISSSGVGADVGQTSIASTTTGSDNSVPTPPDDNSVASQISPPSSSYVPETASDATNIPSIGDATSGPPPIKVIADNINNSLVIRCLPSQYPEIQQALSELDVQPLEVLIDASVAEVTLTNQFQYGVQYYIKGGSVQAIQTTATTAVATAALPGFAAIYQQGQSIPFILSALQALTTVNVLSAPELMVLNNETAKLQVGDEVPIATQQAQSTEVSDSPVINSIAYQNTGVILNVTPRVNAGGLVTMDISQEVSDVSTTTTSSIDSPTISVRDISSTIAIHDGQTVALGGLISDTRTNSKSGIPYLENIPYLGSLFSTTNHQVNRTELLVLLTPHVVGNQSQAQAITNELRTKLAGTLSVLSVGQ